MALGRSSEYHWNQIISKSVHQFSISLFLFIALAAIFFNRAKQFEQLSRELPKEPSCEIISKSVHRFSRSRLKLFSIYSPGGYFVQQSRMV